MKCQNFIVLFEPIGIQLFDSLSNLVVDLPAPLLQQARISHLLGEGVFEYVLELRVEGLFIKDLKADQVVQVVPQFVSQCHDALKKPKRKISADHTCHLHGSFEILTQTVHSSSQHPLDRARNLTLVNRLLTGIHVSSPDKITALEEFSHCLLHEKRIPLGLVHDLLFKIGVHLHSTEKVPHKTDRRPSAKRLDSEPVIVSTLCPGWRCLRAVGNEHQDPVIEHRTRKVGEELL